MELAKRLNRLPPYLFVEINQKIAELIGFAYNVVAVNGTDVYHITSDDYPSLYNYHWVFSFPIGIYEELELQNY